MEQRIPETAAWPFSRLGDAMLALAQKAGLSPDAAKGTNPNESSERLSAAAWIEWHAKLLGCEAEPIESSLATLEDDLPAVYPAVLRVRDDAYLAILDAGRDTLRVITPALRFERIAVAEVSEAIRAPVQEPKRVEIERLLAGADVAFTRQSRAASLLAREQLGEMPFHDCWTLRVAAGARPMRWLREPNALRNVGKLLSAHTLQYLLWVGSWAILGSLSFSGRLDRGWLLAWALLLMTLVPFRVATTWLQGALAIGVGGILKRRLLAGALRLEPEEMRHQGLGSFLGQVFEAEAVETLALSGGVTGLLAILELVVSGFVLGRFAIVLAGWCCLAGVLAWRFLRSYQTWTDTRMDMTSGLLESMVGQRTRLAQQPCKKWHEEEDRALDRYLEMSRRIDRVGQWLIAAVPRGWLLAGLACLVPSVVAAKTAPAQIAILLGGVLLAFSGFKRLAGAFTDVAGAWTPWRRVGPLFRAAARPERLEQVYTAERGGQPEDKIVEAERLTFRYRETGAPALQSCSLVIRRGERILLEGPSGGGKTTFASLLSGMREPESGLLLINGLDRHTLGDKRWRRQVAAAPQFHENHIVTETLAFNLLMGRAWPPAPKDIEEAEAVCRELGLGELLDRMPSGLLQMVGEGGWQLSHGERSRIYIARALLQSAEMVILDESFAALDPESLQTALECTLQRSETLMVVAHP